MASDGQAASALPDGGLHPAQPVRVPDEVGIYHETPTASNSGGGHLDTITTIPMEMDHDSGLETASSSSEDSLDTTAGAAQTSAGMDTHAPSSRKRKSLDRSVEPDEKLRHKEKQKKVKLDVDLDLVAQHANQYVQSRVKDNSLGRDKSLLPPEIWHHIFTFCPPKSLGNLLRVNKLFNQYLDPSLSVRSWFPVLGTKNGLSALKPNAIWQASRRLYWPQMPTPLRSKTELDMWRLACSAVCQSCKKSDARGQPSLSDALRPGPGPNGVAIVWPFANRMCLSCLFKTSIKEVDILLSPTIPNAILPALPFVLLGQDLSIFPANMLESGQLAPDFQVTRLYSASDVEALEKEFMTVKDMGSGTVDEWLKGLEGRGNDMRHEASKWEKWESSGGLAKMCSQLYPGYEARLIPAPDQGLSASSSGAPPSPSSTPSHPGLPNRPERSLEVVAELKAARKAEIERRAMRLEPPLTPGVLGHIPAFRAATQIIAPLDESAWGLLKQRLLAQRAEAEQREKGGAASTIKAENAERQLETTLATTKEARDLIDKEWEEIQAPVRAKIAGYADEIIREKWDKGRKLFKDTCPKFATDVLIYIRKRFYDEVAKDAAAARAQGRSPVVDPPEGPFTQKLTLENMKWIFDTKIKPHTESYRKELFYCNGCEGNFKTFGFEGVVQHYAAKHTSSLSVGSIVVHWRAEWPEHPPFASEGRPVKQPFFGQGPGPSSMAAPFPHSTSLPSNTYQYQPPPAPTPPHGNVYLPSSGSGYGAPPYGEHYPQPPPPQPYPPQPQPTYGPPAPFAPPGSYGSQQPYAPPPSPYPPYQPPTGPYPPPPIGADPASSYAPPPSGNYLYPYGSHQVNVSPVYSAPVPVPPPAPYPDTYQTKLEDIARNSREIWHALGSVKDLPGSARVFATIHHLVKRYRTRFYETPPLAMFIDGLSNNKDMRPVRNVNGLVCKTCHLGLGNAASVEQDRKSFSLPQLANHFQSKHVEPMQHMNPQLDWIVDMVLLPDPAIISDILPSAGENQRAMLNDAFPEARLSRPAVAGQPPYEGHYGHAGAYPAHPGVAHPTFYGHQAPGIDHNQSNENGYHANRHPMEGYGPDDYFASAQVTKPDGTPANHHATGSDYLDDRAPAKLEIDPPAHNAGGRRSPQEPQQSRHENGAQTHKKKGGKNKRGKPPNRNENNHRLLEEDVKRDENEARREEEEIRAMWAADRAGAARAYTSTKLPMDEQEAKDKLGVPQTAAAQQRRTHTPQNAQLPQQTMAQPVAVAARPEKETAMSNIMAALESHLDQGHSSGTPNHQPGPSDGLYLDTRISGVLADSRSASRTYGRYSDEGNRSRSPASYGSRYHQPALAPRMRERSPPAPQLEPQHEPPYYSRPFPSAEHNEASYDRYRARSEYPEQRPRHPDDRRYDVAPRRPDEYGHEQTARPEYPRYPEDGPVPSRGPVELYEIVHVIDEHGEYYIRRPVRREAEPPRYIYEEGRRAYRDADPYAGYEPVRAPAPAPRPSRLESQRAGIRADPAYQEEYDPRFPGV